MAYLSKAELKSLKKVPVVARLVYVFSMKTRADATGTTSYPSDTESDEHVIAADIAHPLNPAQPDDEPTINLDAVKARIDAMHEAGFISKADVRKLHELFGI